MRFLVLLLLLTDLSFAASPVETIGEPALSGKVSETVGVIRWRRRHENDMDFSKYNPFYWQGRLAEFTIRDFSSSGQKRLEVELRTEWPQDYIPTRGPDFSAVYTGDPNSPTEHLRSKFLFNIRTEHVKDNRVFKAVLDEGAFNVAGLKPGQILTMEFRSFMNESFPDWRAQKQKNPHNISSYYSEFIRIKLGEPGLVIDHPFKENGEAVPERYAFGKTTIPTSRVEPWRAMGQMALNIEPKNAQAFLFGRTWIHTNFETGEHVTEDSDDKPSVFFDKDRDYRRGYQGTAYNVSSCVACHHNNGSALMPVAGSPIHTTILRSVDTRNGGKNQHSAFGQQIQTQGQSSEATVKITGWDITKETLAGGETVELRRPRWDIQSSRDKSFLGYSPRRPLPFLGLGLLEAIPEETIKGWAKENGGRVSLDNGRVGRFGHKAERSTIMDQIGSAMNTDLGVNTETFQRSDCSNNCKWGKGALFQPALKDIETYLRLLGGPPRLNPDDSGVKRGRLVFSKIGCHNCHIPNAKTGSSDFAELSNQDIQPFTDLLLHDMGEGLKDATGNDLSGMWRTSPLWGFRAKRASTDSRSNQFRPGDASILWKDTWKAVEANPIELLHDGRARNNQEAILWHDGEAKASKEAYKKLDKQERQDLLLFLEDL